jgi:ubiquinone/menaquinone biosynthesis C-methylase UbiE
MKPCGVKYNNMILAHMYDSCHRLFRDYKQEAELIVDLLALGPDATVIDMGCGTGAFAVHAAPYFRKVHAVDVSKAMLRRARRKAKKARLDNIEFHHGGFLTYEHRAEPADAVSSVAVLHHLPDFWKLVGLQRMAAMLKPRGKLYLFDVVFSFDTTRYESSCKRFVKTMSARMGSTGQIESETHLRSEYSTCDWIMEGLLNRAGFDVTSVDRKDDFLVAYVCTKRDE